MAGKEIEEIKKKIDLVDFIRGYVDLQPAGKSLKALCPFHGEKTPSFVVSPDRGRWHCFGSCGEGGDIFTFLMKYENIEFYEALQILADRAGIELQKLDPQKQKEFGILYDINAEAKNFFRAELSKNTRALEYLKNRGLEDQTIETFELGYSPGGEALTARLIELGHDMRDIERAGVSYKNSRGLYWDKFQRRIMFPIANSVGKVVAFTGRILPQEKGDPSTSHSTLRVSDPMGSGEMPKYLNSPETPIFHKSKILYGYHITKKAIGDLRSAFLVEGQMDVLMAWQAGVRNVVAVSGTALTEHHLEKLRRQADSVILSFDNDEAGAKAMERALDIFSKFDFHVQVIELGEHKDPADAARADSEFLKKAIVAARAAFPRLFEIRFKGIPPSDIPGRKRLIRELLVKLKGLPSPTDQETW
ncbi:MAG: CHC2 zinc finger domain-containing protein, partial [bacterium]|nr:CHC2 zinc finger domain-containing protein [bacterium]